MENIVCKKKNGKILVLNTRSGCWFVDRVDSEVLEHPDGYIAIDEIKNTQLYGRLIEEGILADKEPLIEQSFENELTLLILDTTKACNLACKYCFVDAPSRGGNMTMEIAMKALNLSLDYPKCSDTLTVEFSGGEPLVNFELIKEFTPKALKLAEEKGKNLKFTIQTNGTLLNGERLSFLIENEFNIGISVDGTKEFQDKNRVFVDGTGSSHIIVENIRELQLKGCHTSVLSVISSPDQYDSVAEFALENNIKEVRTNLVTKAGRAEGKENFTIDYKKLAEKYLDICERILSGKLPIYDSTLTFFLWNLLLNQTHMCFRSPCGAGKNQISVTFDGNIYPCQGWRNIHDNPICNVMKTDRLIEALDNNKRVFELREHNVRKNTICELCDWKAFCGTCPREIYTECGTINAKIGFCDFQIVVFEGLMWMFDEYSESIKKYLLGDLF